MIGVYGIIWLMICSIEELGRPGDPIGFELEFMVRCAVLLRAVLT